MSKSNSNSSHQKDSSLSVSSGRSGSSKNRVSGSEEWNVASSTSSSSSVGGAVASSSNEEVDANAVRLKLALLGNPQVGKTSLMYKYVTGLYDEDYIQTLGVNFLEKSITVRNTTINFVLWDVGGQKEFRGLLPIACHDAVALLFCFDLTRKSTLESVKEWFREARKENKTAFPFLVGTKYDLFVELEDAEKIDITKKARKYAKAMHAPLIFSSSPCSINVKKIFKLVVAKVFDLETTIEQCTEIGLPILEY